MNTCIVLCWAQSLIKRDIVQDNQVTAFFLGESSYALTCEITTITIEGKLNSVLIKANNFLKLLT